MYCINNYTDIYIDIDINILIGVFSGSILHFALIHSRWNKSLF